MIIGENFTSPRMESTNSRQAGFVVNREAVESTSSNLPERSIYTNDIQNITFGLELTKVMKTVMPLMRVLLVVYGSLAYCEHLETLGSKECYMRYLTLMSDGDAKTWTRHDEVVPYGKSILIE